MRAFKLRMTRRSRLNWILLIQSFILSSPWLIKLGTRDFQFCIFCAKFQKAWNFSWVPDKTRNFSEFRKAHSNLIILLRSCPLENITEQTTSAVMETYSAMLISEFPTVLALDNLELVCFYRYWHCLVYHTPSLITSCSVPVFSYIFLSCWNWSKNLKYLYLSWFLRRKLNLLQFAFHKCSI